MSNYIHDSNSSPFWRVSESEIRHCHRGKYAIDENGEMRLLSIQSFSRPVFIESGYELCDNPKKSGISESSENSNISEEERMANLRRASRRAKISAFDMIECNPDLDVFATLTISPEVANRSNWNECYELMRVWLSNRVQRRAMKYILVPEYHKDGESIHFHGIFNSASLKMERARSPKGLLVYRKGRPLYNLTDVDFGFTTATPISGESSRDKVSKYIFKYMGKQYENGITKVGGRYFLHGGKLSLPVYRYADDLSELLPGTPEIYKKAVVVTNDLSYEERYYI